MSRTSPNLRNTDPVCGDTIDRTKSTVSIYYNGRTLHFCSVYCRDRFSKKPRHYICKRRRRRLAPRIKLPTDGMNSFYRYKAKCRIPSCRVRTGRVFWSK
jgi:YHS domain-containing protein